MHIAWWEGLEQVLEKQTQAVGVHGKNGRCITSYVSKYTHASLSTSDYIYCTNKYNEATSAELFSNIHRCVAELSEFMEHAQTVDTWLSPTHKISFIAPGYAAE